MFPWTTFLRLLQHTDGLDSGRPFLILPLLFLVLECEPFTKEDEDEEEAKEEEDGICNEAMNRADGGGVQEAEAMAAEAASESTQKKKTT